MATVEILPAGSNGDDTALDVIQQIYRDFSRVESGWRSFVGGHIRQVAPIQAQLGEPEAAIAKCEDIGSEPVRVIALAEVAIAIRSSHADLADAALAAATSLAEEKGEGFRTSSAAPFAAIASALTTADRDGGAWLERALSVVNQENNPYETVMGISRYHFHRGELDAACDAICTRPGGYIGHFTSFHDDFAKYFLETLVGSGRADLALKFAATISDVHARANILERITTTSLQRGEPDIGFEAAAMGAQYGTRLLEQIGEYARANRDTDLLKRVVELGLAGVNPEYIGGYLRWPRWMQSFDVQGARDILKPHAEEIGSETKHRRLLHHLAQTQAALGDLDRALVSLEGVKSPGDRLFALFAGARHRLAMGDRAGVIDIVLELEKPGYEVGSSYETASLRTARLLAESGDRIAGLGRLELDADNPDSRDRLDQIATLQRELGDLAGAARTVLKGGKTEYRDDKLSKVAVAFGAAGDFAGVLRCMEQMKLPRKRGYAGSDALYAWSKASLPYYSVKTFC